MISSILRLASLAICAIVLVSFGLFALDQARNGEQQTVSKLSAADNTASSAVAQAPASSDTAQVNINEADPSAAVAAVRAKRHGSVRDAIDKANDVIVSPFTGVVSASSSIWAQRGVTALLALLVFGLGLRLLGAYLSPGRWR